MPKIILKINSLNDKIYKDDSICCYLINSALPVDFIKKMQSQGIMTLLYGDNAAELCKSLNTDGMVMELDPKLPVKVQVNKIRDNIGTKKVLGTGIYPHRHEAMLVSETEPEFVIFKFPADQSAEALELLKWYNELFLIQSAIDLSDGLQDVKAFDTDFVIINSADYEDFGC